MTNGLLLHPSSLLGPPPLSCYFSSPPIYTVLRILHVCCDNTGLSIAGKQPTATQKISINVGRQTDDGCR